MSITSRINEMSSHIEQAYDELQGLGADLTNVNKNIENISMVLDDIYDSMPQVSGEGTSLTLDDTRVGKIKSTLKGNTSQDGTPTPSSPIPVNVVSGDNEINVCGKNLFDKSQIINKTYQGATSSLRFCNPQSIYLEAGTYTFSTNLDTTTYQYKTDILGEPPTTSSSETYIYNSGFLTGATKILTVTTPGYFGFLVRDKDNEEMNLDTVKSFNFQLEKGSTASTYEPYQGNTYNIDLPEGMELCKIGNYQDYFYKDSGKWYLHKEIGKVVLNGSENISIYNQNASRTNFQADVLTGIENYLGNYDVPNLLSNMFNVASQSASWVVGNMSRRKEAQTTLYLTYEPSTTIEAFKAWLSTHNVVVYYVLATPTNTALEDM